MSMDPISPPLLDQLHRHLGERHAHLIERIDELAQLVRAQHAAQLAWAEEHEAYHRAHEHRWGALALARRHPLRLAALAAGLAACLAARGQLPLEAIWRLLALWPG